MQLHVLLQFSVSAHIKSIHKRMSFEPYQNPLQKVLYNSCVCQVWFTSKRLTSETHLKCSDPSQDLLVLCCHGRVATRLSKMWKKFMKLFQKDIALFAVLGIARALHWTVA